MTRALPSLAALVAAALLAALAGSGNDASGARPQPATRTEVVVQLTAPPLARARETHRAAQRLDGQQRRFKEALRETIPAATVRWRYRLVANGLAVVVPRADLVRLSRLPGVKQVFADVTYRTLAGPDAATIRARDLPGSTLGNVGAGRSEEHTSELQSH